MVSSLPPPSRAAANLAARSLFVTLPGNVQALRGVELEVGGGKLVGVLGPNGAGKSTLARALAGLVPAAAGVALVCGDSTAALSRRELARRVAYLAQEAPAELPFTAAEVVLMGRAPHLGRLGLDGPADRERAAAALDAVQALDLADRPLGALSGGERRRVLLARVLAQDAAAWILDEPTAHLDLAHQALALSLARSHADAGGAVLCVLHELSAASLCDEVVLLAQGRVVAAGPPAQLLTAELLAPLFGIGFVTTTHPRTGAPLLLPDTLERRPG